MQTEAFAEYPAQLAIDIVEAIWPLPLPSEPEHIALAEWSRAAPGPQQDPHGPTDGAGRFCQADHGIAYNSATLQPLQCKHNGQQKVIGTCALQLISHKASQTALFQRKSSLKLHSQPCQPFLMLAPTCLQPAFCLGLMRALAAMSKTRTWHSSRTCNEAFPLVYSRNCHLAISGLTLAMTLSICLYKIGRQQARLSSMHYSKKK